MATSLQVDRVQFSAIVQVVVVCVLTLSLIGCGSGSQDTITGDESAARGSDGATGDVTNAKTPTDSAGNAPSLGAATGFENNLAPSVDAISLGCDLVLESIAVTSGEVTNFTLIVDDESPLTLTYSVTSDDDSIAVASVDTDGVFTVQGLRAGTTTMPLIVTDAQGVADQVLLSVVVES